MWHKGIERKSQRELAIMREAGRINALALAAAKAVIRPGVTTAEIDAAAEAVLLRHGARSAFRHYPGPYPYPAATNVCVNEELVHAIPVKRRLQPGDIVTVDCGTLFERFYADSAFTVGVGQISELAARLLRVTETALYVGMDAARPGRRTGDVAAAIQQYVEAHGFSVARDYTGHGIGRHMHEDPQVPNFGAPDRGTVLQPGMVIAIEPMVLAGAPDTVVLADEWTVASRDRSLTAHFEHTIAVTAGEPWVLTTLAGAEVRPVAALDRQNTGRLASSPV